MVNFDLCCRVWIGGVRGVAVRGAWISVVDGGVPGGLAQHNFPYADLPAFIDPIKTNECDGGVVCSVAF